MRAVVPLTPVSCCSYRKTLYGKISKIIKIGRIMYLYIFEDSIILGKTLLFADDQVVIQDSEYKLQKSLHILNQMNKDHNLKISTDKQKFGF